MTLSEKRSKAGRIGGLQTLFRHGREHYSRITPNQPLPTYDEIMQQQEKPVFNMNTNNRQELIKIAKAKYPAFA